ncbi:MAG: cupin domain-containing protein [Muribaculaceae bacterium]|nr:cupin domain-containing protein [Muribaculaceae bacterium]
MIDTNFKFGEVYNLADRVQADSERVQFTPVIGGDNGGVSLLAFKAGQGLSEHLAPAELMVTVLEGEIVFTIREAPHVVRAGEFLLVGEGVPHSVAANLDSKVLLTKIKP